MFDDILKRHPECEDCPVKDTECERCIPTGCKLGMMRKCLIEDGMVWTECPGYKQSANSFKCEYLKNV